LKPLCWIIIEVWFGHYPWAKYGCYIMEMHNGNCMVEIHNTNCKVEMHSGNWMEIA
jgi:hypothetical protein